MNYKTIAIISFILLTIGSVCYVYYNARMPVNKNRIVINEEGEEEIMLNSLEKKHIGKWYLAFEGTTIFNLERIAWEHSRYYDFHEDGKVTYHRPDGRRITYYWQVTEADSVLSIIANQTEIPDTVSYKISKWTKKSFTAYKNPNELHISSGAQVIWQRHD